MLVLRRTNCEDGVGTQGSGGVDPERISAVTSSINEYVIRIESKSLSDHSGDLRSHEARFDYE